MTNVKIQFSGHETFPFRYGWLKKGVDAVYDDPSLFNAEDATTKLGVGKNMVRAIRHWCLAASLLEDKDNRLQVSGLGELLMGPDGLDPYLEDPATLWLLHYEISSKPGRAHTWYWVFNEYKSKEFTRQDLVRDLTGLAQATAARSSANTVKRDVDCFIRTYVPASTARNASVMEDSLDCPLTELNLIEEVGDGETFTFHPAVHHSLSDSVFTYCLLRFWEGLHQQQSLAFEQICYAPSSPGKVLKLTNTSILERLERLNSTTHGALEFDETAGLKQVYRRVEIPSHQFLEAVYRNTNPLVEVR